MVVGAAKGEVNGFFITVAWEANAAAFGAPDCPGPLTLRARHSPELHVQPIRSIVNSAIGAGTHVKERAQKAPVVLKDTSRAGKCP